MNVLIVERSRTAANSLSAQTAPTPMQIVNDVLFNNPDLPTQRQFGANSCSAFPKYRLTLGWYK